MSNENIQTEGPDIPLAQILDVIARDSESVDYARPESVSDIHPTEGRVAKETVGTRDVYIGDGNQWNNVSEASALLSAIIRIDGAGTISAGDENSFHFEEDP